MEELLDLINSPLNFKNNKKKSHHFNFRSFSNKKSLHPNLNKSNEKQIFIYYRKKSFSINFI